MIPPPIHTPIPTPIPPPIPTLHLVTDDSILARPAFLTQAREVLERGGRQVAFHLRGPGVRGRTIFDLAEALLGDARRTGCLLLVNDRVDVALSLDLPGAHLGQRSIPPSEARRILGSNRVLGLSVHSGAEAEGVAGEHVDFLIVGALFPTPSHTGEVPGGPERLREVGASSRLPLLGIGGITPERVQKVLDVGAFGVAVRGGVWDAPDPAEAVGNYLRELSEFSVGPRPVRGTGGGTDQGRVP